MPSLGLDIKQEGGQGGRGGACPSGRPPSAPAFPCLPVCISASHLNLGLVKVRQAVVPIPARCSGAPLGDLGGRREGGGGKRLDGWVIGRMGCGGGSGRGGGEGKGGGGRSGMYPDKVQQFLRVVSGPPQLQDLRLQPPHHGRQLFDLLRLLPGLATPAGRRRLPDFWQPRLQSGRLILLGCTCSMFSTQVL